MIEHNNEYYVKVIERLNSWNLCCCCKSLIIDVVDHEIAVTSASDDGNSAKVNADDTIHETRGISTDFLQVPGRLIVTNSELTSVNECSTSIMM